MNNYQLTDSFFGLGGVIIFQQYLQPTYRPNSNPSEALMLTKGRSIKNTTWGTCYLVVLLYSSIHWI